MDTEVDTEVDTAEDTEGDTEVDTEADTEEDTVHHLVNSSMGRFLFVHAVPLLAAAALLLPTVWPIAHGPQHTDDT